jgi:hypothetical protein
MDNFELWDVRRKVRIFTKSRKSQSYYCDGYFIVRFEKAWVKSHCPKLITINRYPYKGPFGTKEEMENQLKSANKDLT